MRLIHKTSDVVFGAVLASTVCFLAWTVAISLSPGNFVVVSSCSDSTFDNLSVRMKNDAGGIFWERSSESLRPGDVRIFRYNDAFRPGEITVASGNENILTEALRPPQRYRRVLVLQVNGSDSGEIQWEYLTE